ncbi:hypothetical protein DPMN_065010 [Dreissena polymorpha]|uniref:Uncharacterized protein n=1 Tax=Dreissena polymorpha TaxID=45954 RepID=A0A9D4HMP7_DREPO|nr:hypothetical protein DPMN_065010 [Dreissena polymorpha]
MNVIGKEGVDIMGFGPSSLDTSILQLTDMRDDDQQDAENNMTMCTSSAAMSKSVSFNQKRRLGMNYENIIIAINLHAIS